jgi:uncharacterized protein
VSLTPTGGRVLGCLVEKQLTTPQQYPLTLNALTLACSQSTNREPVMTLGEDDVQTALQALKEQHLVRFVLPSHGKSVVRYRHVVDEAYGLDAARVALLAVLLLRGPQTPGELRARTARMVEFDSLDSLQGELQILADQPEPLVHLLARQPGQKEDRWQQLLADEAHLGSVPGAPDRSAEDRPDAGQSSGDDSTPRPGGLDQRMADLESEVSALRDELRAVDASLAALRQSLGE